MKDERERLGANFEGIEKIETTIEVKAIEFYEDLKKIICPVSFSEHWVHKDKKKFLCPFDKTLLIIT